MLYCLAGSSLGFEKPTPFQGRATIATCLLKGWDVIILLVLEPGFLNLFHVFFYESSGFRLYSYNTCFII